ncbi:hypothetical protein Kpol_1028p94 [Vanderwaltozyma polyspora DSM 70294]|uniref:Uncharacterized protein n=1 Tax=Vanderwaltozyma polyspora (strain ATCC 22028 / DSM 70294 / BCRC 21397 / CBS 2163 / NBRC 10782 / NRRL Y-8283 / UCD 57-17) TaxID=436907 RepID=A7TG61_VANPO|nr:uncharacterized protein Kpol_1028p94 [Vanderwaltozyma polyspora DSM 70294]EDO18818.1 hypothetical protein Kpol_1028p94 [Vanderwaltozyma polyspora DSM 70294]
MGFYRNNSVFEFFDRIFKKPADLLMWMFTGIIITSTFLLLLPSYSYNGLNKKKK